MATNGVRADEDEDAVDRLARRLSAREVLSDVEERTLRAAIAEMRSYAAGQVIVSAGVPMAHCTLLVSGIVGRFRDLDNGQRQIMELHIPGDFLDLHSFLLSKLEHDVGALTQVRLALVPHEAIRRITETQPHLTRMLWLSTLLDASLHRERVLSVGRRSAVSRIAHLICELYTRLEIIGLAEGKRFALPLTQADLADTTGLTAVHVNRMLRTLRDDKLMTYRNGEVVIHDWDGLAAVAEFDDAFLHRENWPR